MTGRLTITDPEAFIRANTELTPTPHAPEVRLHVATESTELWRKTEEELGEIGLPPPFWAFAWAGGQALARWLLDNPEAVRGRRVLDFASGSGLAGIAAALAGAAPVETVDIDPFALAAIRLNAQANGVALTATREDLVGQDRGWEVVLAGDVCYERDMARAVTDWLEALARRGALVLVGDPGRSYLPRERLQAVATYQVPTTRELEDNEVKRTTVWRFAGLGAKN
ncbi:class I SAM-dependent methyltransferase [Alsobacter soli]|uniref:class I SAM-dependent methyltransferase n=1 Tax=Alsobacter soli TaxID=2109933 RepID=UPI001FE021ED|nr:methyltransferase [Alsobacter soli]